MPSILDRVEAMTARIQPATVSEFIALRIARKLDDLHHGRVYLEVSGRNRPEAMIAAYLAIARGNSDSRGLAAFQVALSSPSIEQMAMPPNGLAAIRVDRRTIAAALFTGVSLQHTERRHLKTEWEQASTSTAGFMNWLIATFKVGAVALERVTNARDVRRQHLSQICIGICRTLGVPVWDVPHTALLESFSVPPLKNDTELRRVVAAIWPVLNARGGGNWTLDAAALGLFHQVERLLGR